MTRYVLCMMWGVLAAMLFIALLDVNWIGVFQRIGALLGAWRKQ